MNRTMSTEQQDPTVQVPVSPVATNGEPAALEHATPTPSARPQHPQNQPWREQVARDFIAVGSWVFYILIFGRALIRPFRPLTDQLFFGALLLILAKYLVRRHDQYVARGVVLAVAVIIFYENITFSIFIVAASVGLIIASRRLGSAWRDIAMGLLIGGIAAAIAVLVGHYTQHFLIEGVAGPQDDA
jgi:hypothetical protein